MTAAVQDEDDEALAPPGSEEAGSAVPDRADEGAKAQEPRRGRARVYATHARGLASYWLAVLRTWWERRRQLTDVERSAPRIRRDSVWRQPLPTISELVAATRAGLWAPGNWPKPVENVGKAYGWAVAIPLSLVLYGVAYIVQHPGRLTGTVVFLVLLVVSL